MKKQIRVLHLFADLLDLYGDGGNLMVLSHVLKQMGHDCVIDRSSLYDIPDFQAYDLIYCGPGKLKNIIAASSEFTKQNEGFHKAMEKDIPILFTGNAMMLLANSFSDVSNNMYNSSGLLDIRMKDVNAITIKDVVSRCSLTDGDVIGFINRTYEITENKENHPLFEVKKGLKEKTEGFLIGSMLVTMQLGPLLVRNPELLNWFTQKLVGENAPVSKNAGLVHDLTLKELL